MKCPTCRAAMIEEQGAHVYDAQGIKAVLLNATIRTCPECGERAVGIRKLAQLNATIAAYLCLKAEALTPAEIRFLRVHIGWSGADLARQFRVSPATVSRWENGKQAMGEQVEMLLRLAAYQCEPVRQYASAPFPLERLGTLGASKGTMLPLRFTLSRSNMWSCEQASEPA